MGLKPKVLVLGNKQNKYLIPKPQEILFFLSADSSHFFNGKFANDVNECSEEGCQINHYFFFNDIRTNNNSFRGKSAEQKTKSPSFLGPVRLNKNKLNSILIYYHIRGLGFVLSDKR